MLISHSRVRRLFPLLYSRFFQLIAFVLSVYFFYNAYRNHTEKQWIDPECLCKDQDGNEYDFCYHLPENGKKGKRFACDYVKDVKRLGLLPDYPTIDLTKSHVPEPIFVTAFSENHWDEAKRLIALIRQHWRQQKVIIYDLGITSSTAAEINGFCNVELRKFPFDVYPQYVRQLAEYRWKPIVIAETLKEFGAIWYMDSSITWRKQNLSHVYDLLNCRSKVGFEKTPLPSIAERDSRENTTIHESGWTLDVWDDNLKACRKSAYMFHGWTGHGIYPATSHHLYEWIPTNFDEIIKPKAKMYEAGFVYAVRTKDTVERIMRWYVLCALEDNCMAPRGIPGISLGCQWGASKFSDYANCHRYDQSVANLLAANGFNNIMMRAFFLLALISVATALKCYKDNSGDEHHSGNEREVSCSCGDYCIKYYAQAASVKAATWDCGCATPAGMKVNMCTKEGKSTYGSNPVLEVNCCSGDLCNGSSTAKFSFITAFVSFFLYMIAK
ncbi:unnamed protein product, partial [Mesorhabditis belari]|uniref:Uncharacterized protein n=1 Tax=Mesorhabditis belari TaxID=2138241 RepID=A0AAF3FTD5_9BILA